MSVASGPPVAWPLEALLAALGCTWLRPPTAPTPITEITLDPAEVRPGVLFIARTGWYGDTHARLAEVVAQGASALLVTRPEALPAGLAVPVALAPDEDPTLARVSARFYGRPTAALEVLAVTGTNGKTSTVWIASQLLAALGARPARLGTIDFSFENHTVAASNTTPDALVVQRFAHDARALGATALVLEASSHGLALQRLAEVAFDAVGFTQLGRDHLDFHRTLAGYRAAKRRLFTDHVAAALSLGKRPTAVAWVGPAPDTQPPDTQPPGTRPPATPATDHDDPEAPADEGAALLAASPSGARRLAVGAPAALDGAALPADTARLRVWATPLPRLAGQRCTFQLDAGPAHTADLPLIGGHNLQNAAVAVGLVVGGHPQRLGAAVAALPRLRPVPGRLERVSWAPEGEATARSPGAPELPLALVDYAHTADAVARVVATVRAGTDLPLRVVLGCGGDRDASKRGPMARAALAADALWFTADNPRGEDAEAILDAMYAALSPAEAARVRRVPDRAAAIEAAIAAPGPAVVLVLGKGHETTQTVGGRVFHLDDRQEVRRALGARAAGLDGAQAPLEWGFGPADPTGVEARLRQLLARPDAPEVLETAQEMADPAAAGALQGPRAEVLARLNRAHRVVRFTDGPPAPDPQARRGPHLPSLVPRPRGPSRSC